MFTHIFFSNNYVNWSIPTNFLRYGKEPDKICVNILTFLNNYRKIHLSSMMTTKEIADHFSGTKRLFKEGSTIIYQGEIPRNAYVITKGAVKVYTLQNNGDELIAAFLGPGDFLPLSWIFGATTSSPFYYETMEFCEAKSILKSSMNEALENSPELRIHVMKKMALDHVSLLMRITALEQSRATEKILFTLYYLLYQFGVKTGKDENDYIINIKLVHATLASLIGLTRETTATELSKLKQKGIISYKKKIYQVNKLKLEKAIGEDGFSELIK